ncbi:hypothetical protein ACFFSY_14880 [Paenibacillus aurantiacus]|uniref:Uncharacterized protein n=1 Tax=Paenibacillus aurantiacus TaxID=1936118 RepID=A0ABV5KQN5_9BACL
MIERATLDTYDCFSFSSDIDVEGVRAVMHQSRKEQGVERSSRRLLQPDRREALIFSELEEDIEAASEWAVGGVAPRRGENGSV